MQDWFERPSIRGKPLTREAFITWLADLSENNFMYLRYILPEIKIGVYKDSDLKSLPKGLTAYYEDHWNQMGMKAKPVPELKITIIYILCEARQSISLKMITDILTYNKFDVRPFQVQAVLDEWSNFWIGTRCRMAIAIAYIMPASGISCTARILWRQQESL
jgi:hypothetical protein